jgi:hypothetical protein
MFAVSPICVMAPPMFENIGREIITGVCAHDTPANVSGES